ncbi:ferredoxin--NADP reductase [Chitinophaga sp.]|uniref:ferredoxin--NADP reductase n=1 Tax=Chitinophaga sp. TaxID=1869181 RepID=UPI002F931237
MTNTYTWSTAAIVRETNDAVTVIFNTNGTAFDYKPGQFVNITLTIAGEPVTRSYSLSSLPEDTHPAITVKRVASGKMSNYIVDEHRDIHTWQVSGPHGSFVMPDQDATVRHLVLLAGGSGITPLFAIGRSFLNQYPDATVTLIYSSRSTDDIIFKALLESWADRHRERLKIHYALSQEAAIRDMSHATVSKGRVNKLIAKKVIKSAVADLQAGTRYFICGPAALMKMHQEMLAAMQVPADNIFLEWFAPVENEGNVALPESQQEVLLHFYEQSNLLEVGVGKSILAAALEDRIPLPHSCKAGTCGICAARLTAGKVTMLNNFSLRQADLESGLILLCQSYPLTADVTVEID